MRQVYFCITLISIFLFSTIFTGVANSSHVVSEDNPIAEYEGWKLVWSEEFDVDGLPNGDIWSHEEGFVRNEELQWYKKGNAYCEDGLLKIEGKIERVVNPNYDPNATGGNSWKKTRQYAEYTSSSINTRYSNSWTFGRFEVRARLPISSGSWPAIWTLGTVNRDWPSNGEIDIMELYKVGGRTSILANAAWGSGKAWTPTWDAANYPLTHFSDNPDEWGEEFHLWRMDWDADYIRLYMDDMENPLNTIELSKTINVNENGFNPFHYPQYVLLNLALGGNGGTLDNAAFPLVYEVDYVRVYQVDDGGDSSLNEANEVKRSVEYIIGDNSLRIFMNESSLGNDMKISVYSINGSRVFEIDASAEKSMSVSLGIKPEAGVYLVWIADGQGRNTVHKIVVY